MNSETPDFEDQTNHSRVTFTGGPSREPADAAQSSAVTSDTAAQTRCPRCQAELMSQRNAAPWCPACEWGLDRYEPDRRRPEVGWRWVDRRLFRGAYRLTDRQYAALLGRPVGRGGRGGARVLLIAAAVVLAAAVLGM